MTESVNMHASKRKSMHVRKEVIMTVTLCAMAMAHHGHPPPLASSLIRDPLTMRGCRRKGMVDAVDLSSCWRLGKSCHRHGP